MKWIAAILLIVNVAVYLWSSGRQVEEVDLSTVSRSEVNREGMLLLSETGGLKQVGTIAGVEDAEEEGEAVVMTAPVGDADEIVDPSQPDAGDAGDSLSEVAENEVAENIVQPDGSKSSVARTCFRLGPFRKGDSWREAMQWMGEQGIDYTHVLSDSRELQGTRVFLGPYASRSRTDPVVAQLTEKNLENFVYSVDDGSFRVSLGYFAQKALAEKFVVHLRSMGITAEQQPEYRKLEAFNWMEIPMASAGESELKARDWGEPAVRLSEVDC